MGPWRSVLRTALAVPCVLARPPVLVFLGVLGLGIAGNLAPDCSRSPHGGIEARHGFPHVYLTRWRNEHPFHAGDFISRDPADPLFWYEYVALIGPWALGRDIVDFSPAAALGNAAVVVLLATAFAEATAWRLRRRRWYQLSLVELLLLITLSAFLFGSLGNGKRIAERQKEIIHEFRLMEVAVEYEPACPDWALALFGDRGDSLSPPPRWQILCDDYLPRKDFHINLANIAYYPGPASLSRALACAGELHDVESIWIHNVELTHSDLAQIARLSDLEHLSLDNCAFPKRSFACLGSLRKLRALDLGRARIDDFSPLESFSQLEILSLNNTRISDEDLRVLEQLTRLRTLDLYSQAISDAGLRHLEHLPRLEEVKLCGPRVTEAGVARLWESGVNKISGPIELIRLDYLHCGKFAVVVNPKNRGPRDRRTYPSLYLRIPESRVCVVYADEVLGYKWPRHAGNVYGSFFPHHDDVTPQPGRAMLIELPKRVDRGVAIHEFFVGTPEEFQSRPKHSAVDERIAQAVEEIVSHANP